ncbi:hypothetical protein BDV12DRAFT_201115 [Aspergillus spectabilis]
MIYATTFVHFLLGIFLFLSPQAYAQDTSTSSESISSPTSTSTETPTSSPSGLPGRWGGAIENGLPPGSRGRSTAFVPTDDSFPSRAVRQAGYSVEQYQYQVSNQFLTGASLRGFTGSIIETLDTDANLGGRGQAVLTHGQRDGDSCANASFPIRLYSGLGEEVTILEEDIPWEGGIYHIISGPFTRPTTLSSSLGSFPQTSTFASYISSQISALDTTTDITVFVPVNDGLAEVYGSNATISESEAIALVDTHVVEGTVAWSPLLVNGVKFQTITGEVLTVTADPNGDIFLNDEIRVIQTDILIANGVVHLIERPLSSTSGTATGTGTTPSTSPQGPTSTTTGGDTVFTGAAGRPVSNDPTWRVLLGLFAAIVGGTLRF